MARRDADIERIIVEGFTALGMPSPGDNLVVVAFWEPTQADPKVDNLGIQISYRRLVMDYQIAPARVTTRHPFEKHGRTAEAVYAAARAVVVESLWMARQEWRRAHRVWPSGYPVIDVATHTADRLTVPAAG